MCALLCVTLGNLIGAKRKHSTSFLAAITETISEPLADYIQ